MVLTDWIERLSRRKRRNARDLPAAEQYVRHGRKIVQEVLRLSMGSSYE
jgi:hypothetical protein